MSETLFGKYIHIMDRVPVGARLFVKATKKKITLNFSSSSYEEVIIIPTLQRRKLRLRGASLSC